MKIENLNSEFDKDLRLIPSLKWLPWIGPDFQRSGMLILGDSFYDDKDGSEWLFDKLAPRYLINNYCHPAVFNFRHKKLI